MPTTNKQEIELAAIEVKVPDIGDFKDVPVIEVLVKPGDTVKKDDSLITLESDKATMEVPAPSSGTVKDIRVKVGDKVSQGVAILTLEGGADAAKPAPAPTPAAMRAESPAPKATPAAGPARPTAGVAPAQAGVQLPAAAPAPAPAPAAPAPAPAEAGAGHPPPHASPGVRRFARELGVDIAQVKGSGPKGRILEEDIQGYVKGALAGATALVARPAGGGLGDLGLPAWPKVDFAKF